MRFYLFSGHFHFAKYVDTLLHSRLLTLQGRSADTTANMCEDTSRNKALQSDLVCQKYLIQATEHYVETLHLDIKLDKYVYEALPRLLSLWFEFTSIPSQPPTTEEKPKRSTFRLTQTPKEVTDGHGEKFHPELRSHLTLRLHLSETLHQNQIDLNAFIANRFKQIPAQAFYTALPQIVSRVNHGNVSACIVYFSTNAQQLHRRTHLPSCLQS